MDLMRAIRKSEKQGQSSCTVTKTIGRSGAFEVTAGNKTLHSKLRGISQGRMSWPVEKDEVNGIVRAIEGLSTDVVERPASPPGEQERRAQELAERFKCVMHLCDSYYM